MSKGLPSMIYNLKNYDYYEDIDYLIKSGFDHRFLLGTIYSSPKIANYLKSLTHCNQQFFYGILDAGKLASFSYLKVLDKSLHLNLIVTHPNSRGKNFGAAMFEAYKNIGIEMGMPLSLHVDSRNLSSIFWYESHGFKIVDKKKKLLMTSGAGNLPLFESLNILDVKKFNDFGFGFGSETFEGSFGKRKIKFGVILPNSIVIQNEIPPEIILKMVDKYKGVNLFFNNKKPKGVFHESTEWEIYHMTLDQ